MSEMSRVSSAAVSQITVMASVISARRSTSWSSKCMIPPLVVRIFVTG